MNRRKEISGSTAFAITDESSSWIYETMEWNDLLDWFLSSDELFHNSVVITSILLKFSFMPTARHFTGSKVLMLKHSIVFPPQYD